MPNEKSAVEAVAESGQELFLLRLRFKVGRLIDLGGNKPILLDDPETAYVVYAGMIDIFTVIVEEGVPTGPRHHFCRVESGQFFFGMDSARNGIGLLAVAGVDTQLVRVRRAQLIDQLKDPAYLPEMVGLLERWVINLSDAVARDLPPKETHLLTAGEDLELAANETVRAAKGVLWVQHQLGSSYLIGNVALPRIEGGEFFPITDHTWLQANDAARLGGFDTRTFMARDPAWTGLTHLHTTILTLVNLYAEQAAISERKRLQQKAEADRTVAQHASQRLAAILETRREVVVQEPDSDPLFAAVQLIGTSLGMNIRKPQSTGSGAKYNPLDEISRASRVHVRTVSLNGPWWKRDSGPMLAYMAETHNPVALMPGRKVGYNIVDTHQNTRIPVTMHTAGLLARQAYSFYPTFPDKVLEAGDLIRFGLRGRRNDLIMLILMSVAGGLLALVVPLVTGQIVDSVIPGADRSQLLQLTMALIVVALAGMLFGLTRSYALLRLETRLDSSVQSAVWDRVLNLPAPFYRDYSAGDLASRSMGFNVIRQLVSTATTTTILASVFSLFSLALLFSFDIGLALWALLLTAITLAITFYISTRQLVYQRLVSDVQGKLSGTVLQFLTGISKLRVAGAEMRAFAVWAREFSKQRDLSFKARSAANALTVFNSVVPVLTSMALFAVISSGTHQNMSTGSFLAFIAAFSQFLFGATAMSTAFTTILQAAPYYERAKPIFQTLPEIDATKTHPGQVRGGIEISHLSFRYRKDGPLILNDISLKIQPGQFVAFVGPSGAGKSSVFRLLMGLEFPESGSIYYDGQDLSKLDIQALRHQIGVVLQNGKLMPGSVMENINGSAQLSNDDAWDAARMAGLDEDIAQMPMGMYTMISEGASTFSGGQRQRLMIARAIVNKPRILLFDEATSALDNRTQATVSKSLENLQATRIVIAHRLSTIMNADRIFVLQAGKIAQEGSYDELINVPGPFRTLASRQMA